jgi:Ricin-type beta-trefoil lectin domain-like
MGKIKHAATALSALMVAAGISLLAAGPAAATPSLPASGPQIWVIHNSANGKCLDANPANINTYGDTVRLWSCTDAINQQWTWELVSG